MSEPEPIALCWSGGKDSSLAWHALRESPRYRVAKLVTTLTEDYDRISMHGVRRSLLVAQAKAMGLPLEEVWIPAQANNAIYENCMAEAFVRLREEQHIHTVAFGDIFLEDLRTYRENQFKALHMNCVFPLCQRDTRELAQEFVSTGFRDVTVCIDPRQLDSSFAGREPDESFFADLPADCDPCGENGEYHSFVYRGPGWSRDVPFHRGEIVERDSFFYCDLLPQPLSPFTPTK